MIQKSGFLIFMMLLLFSCPALGAVKVNWEGTVSGNNQTSTDELAWDTGFQASGDWALNEELSFFLRDILAINSMTGELVNTLERCYLRFESDSFRVNLGRQAVIWGIGWFFRPVDMITPVTPLAQEETRLGKDLAVLRWSTSPLTAMDLIAGDHLYGAREEWRFGDTNLRVMGVSQYQLLPLPETVNSLGWDVQGGLAGFYTEGKFSWTDTLESGKATALFGWRKMVLSDRQLFLEYLRNNDSFYSGQNYFAAGLQIPWDELTSFGITGVANLDDGGMVFYGIADLQMTDSLDLRGMIGVLSGKDGSEFVTAAAGARLNVMVQVKYYF